MRAISSYRGNRPTYTQTHKQTGPITIHCAAASVQCKDVVSSSSRFVRRVHDFVASPVVVAMADSGGSIQAPNLPIKNVGCKIAL